MISTRNIRTNALNVEILFTLVSQYDLWSYYTGINIKFGKKIISPIQDEINPSANFFVSGSGDILLKDFRFKKAFNIWSFLRFKFGWSITESLKHIDKDFNLGYYNSEFSLTTGSIGAKHDFKIPEGVTSYIKVKRGPWSTKELEFWTQSFSLETLHKLPIKPLKWYQVIRGDNIYQFNKEKDELLFVFSFGNACYKVYRPESRENKWYSNTPSTYLMGIDDLPWIGEDLYINKGMKELGINYDLGFNAVSLQSENCYPTEEVVKNLKRRFKNIWTIMDIDEAGLKSSAYMEVKYDFKPIILPESFYKANKAYKDLDSIKKLVGLDEIRRIIEECKPKK